MAIYRKTNLQSIKNKLKDILAKPQWTEEDKLWMHNFLNSADAPMLKEVMAEEFVPAILIDDEVGMDASAALLDRIHQRIGVGEKPANRLVPLWGRRLAAASVAIILMLGLYFIFNNAETKKLADTKINAPLPFDALPGGNKAVLTLGDGSNIILDSMENGALTEQGNSKIIKQHDGQIAYEVLPANNQNDVAYNAVTTPLGGQYRLILADGTKVWVNAASSIRYPTAFTDTERMVDITGEVYFEVAPKAQAPFIVKVNGIKVRVLGTHFNINAYRDEASTKVTLLEGSVEVVKGNNKKVIVPGQQAVINEGTENISINTGIDMDRVIAWKNGYFSFDNTDLQSLMRQISRWYDVEIIYKGKPSDEHFIGEVPRNSKLSEVLKILELSNVQSRIENGKIIIEP